MAAPTLVSSTPTNDAVSFSSSDNLTLNFSEEISIGAGAITLYEISTTTGDPVSMSYDFSSYSTNENTEEGTYNSDNLSFIKLQNAFTFTDVTADVLGEGVDNGGLTSWGAQIEIFNQSEAQIPTVVRLQAVDSQPFSISNFDFQAEGAGRYTLINNTGAQLDIYDDPVDDMGMGVEGQASNFDLQPFVDSTYIDFYAHAYTIEDYFGMGPYTNTKFHIDDILLSYSPIQKEYSTKESMEIIPIK